MGDTVPIGCLVIQPGRLSPLWYLFAQSWALFFSIRERSTVQLALGSGRGCGKFERAELLRTKQAFTPRRLIAVDTRWDEKAGLRRDAVRSQVSTCSRHREKGDRQ